MASGTRRVLVLGYGNPGRQDDGLGPALVKELEACTPEGVTLDADYQLNIEDATAVAEHDVVLFVDASKDAAAPYELYEAQPSTEITFTSHAVSPESVLAIAEDHFGGSPDAWVLAIRGYEFEFVEELTPQARENLGAALAFVRTLIRTWQGEDDGDDAEEDHSHH